MAFYPSANQGDSTTGPNPASIMQAIQGGHNCCGGKNSAAATGIQENTLPDVTGYATAAVDLTANDVTGIVVNPDGNGDQTYTFATPADDADKLKAGILEAMAALKFIEAEGAGVVITGADNAAVTTITIAVGVPVNLVNGAGDPAFSAV